jgi:hypothetical protein
VQNETELITLKEEKWYENTEGRSELVEKGRPFIDLEEVVEEQIQAVHHQA